MTGVGRRRERADASDRGHRRDRGAEGEAAEPAQAPVPPLGGDVVLRCHEPDAGVGYLADRLQPPGTMR